MCDQEEGKSEKRSKLCEGEPRCGRWVHNKNFLPLFNTKKVEVAGEVLDFFYCCRTPAWVTPANWLFERGVKTFRAVVEKAFTFKDGQRTILVDALTANGEGGISLVETMSMNDFKQLHMKVFDGNNTGSRYFWVSDAWLSIFRCS